MQRFDTIQQPPLCYAKLAVELIDVPSHLPAVSVDWLEALTNTLPSGTIFTRHCFDYLGGWPSDAYPEHTQPITSFGTDASLFAAAIELVRWNVVHGQGETALLSYRWKADGQLDRQLEHMLAHPHDVSAPPSDITM